MQVTQIKVTDYQTGARAKSVLQSAARMVPGGFVVENLMNEEHTYRGGARGDQARATRKGSNTGWFENHHFLNKDGLAIFWRRWLPEDTENLNGIVILSHGLGEHSGRYERLGSVLANEGNFAVYSLDHQGHGQSEGDRLYVKWFADFVADIKQLTEMAQKLHPDTTKTFLLGHSMGALITIHTAHSHPELFHGVVINSPPLKVEKPPYADKVAPVVASFFPKFPAPGIDTATLCRDEAIMDRYMNDPLVFHGSPTLRLMNELSGAIDVANLAAKDFPVPYLLQHGTADKICLPEGSHDFHAATQTQDKTFHVYDEAFHELFNEPDAHEQAIPRVLEWLSQRSK